MQKITIWLNQLTRKQYQILFNICNLLVFVGLIPVMLADWPDWLYIAVPLFALHFVLMKYIMWARYDSEYSFQRIQKEVEADLQIFMEKVREYHNPHIQQNRDQLH